MERGRRGLVLRAELDRWRLGHPVEPEGDREAEPQAAVAGLGPHLLVVSTMLWSVERYSWREVSTSSKKLGSTYGSMSNWTPWRRSLGATAPL
jgi:hypothetical protein